MRQGSLSSAFRRCVGELGMWSASRLFVRTAREAAGDAGVDELRESLGIEYPVLSMMAGAASEVDVGVPAVDDVTGLCADLKRLIVVGLEADCLDALLPRLPPTVVVALLLDPTFPVDDDRLDASWGSRVVRTDLGSFQRYAGTRSGLLTTIYGTNGFRAVVSRVWVRCHGDDMRTQFRRLIGWNVMPIGMEQYPRWLVETDVGDFTDVIEPR